MKIMDEPRASVKVLLDLAICEIPQLGSIYIHFVYAYAMNAHHESFSGYFSKDNYLNRMVVASTLSCPHGSQRSYSTIQY